MASDLSVLFTGVSLTSIILDNFCILWTFQIARSYVIVDACNDIYE